LLDCAENELKTAMSKLWILAVMLMLVWWFYNSRINNIVS